MAKGKIPITPRAVAQNRAQRPKGTASKSEPSLLLVRIKELDREFARQTKQLTAITKKFGKKIAGKQTDNPTKSSK